MSVGGLVRIVLVVLGVREHVVAAYIQAPTFARDTPPVWCGSGRPIGRVVDCQFFAGWDVAGCNIYEPADTILRCRGREGDRLRRERVVEKWSRDVRQAGSQQQLYGLLDSDRRSGYAAHSLEKMISHIATIFKRVILGKPRPVSWV